jgi:hypothetical protein
VNGLEERLRSELASSTEWVLPAPDPVGRLLRRRRRRQWRTRIGAAAATVTALVAAGGTLATVGSPGPEPAPRPTDTVRPPELTGATITPMIRRLIDSPTRGNLAGDAALVADLTHDLDANRSGWRPAAALTHVKVLLLADVGIERVYSAIYYSDTRAAIVDSSGYPDTSAAQLADDEFGGSGGPARPFLVDSAGVQPTAKPSYSYTTVLAPAGCTIATADAFHLSAGRAVADWTDLHADYAVLDGGQGGRWWRFTCDGAVQETYGEAQPGAMIRQVPTATERGHADPAAVRNAFQAWQTLPGMSITSYRALWGGTPPGGTRPVVVTAGQTSGGVAVNAFLAGTPGGSDPGYTQAIFVAGGPLDSGMSPSPQTSGISTGTAASADFVAVRLPDEQRPWLLSDRILILAPPGTTQVTAAGSVTATVPLSDGVGVLTAKAPATIDLHANGATTRLAEPAGAAALVFDAFPAG